jgi:hypothetical protein
LQAVPEIWQFFSANGFPENCIVTEPESFIFVFTLRFGTLPE